ncbi:MAG: GNAT family N-acetyltransferase [Pseudomonadota bacterium]
MTTTGVAGGIRYSVCEVSDTDDMCQLFAHSFTQFDPPPRALGVSVAEFEQLVRVVAENSVADGLSILARETNTGRIAGAFLVEDAASPEPQSVENLSEKFAPAFALLKRLGESYWSTRSPARGEYLHLAFLGVEHSFFGRGIAGALVHKALENGRNRGFSMAVTEATNIVSQHIFKKIGFVERAHERYAEFRYEGKAVFSQAEEHVGPMLMDFAINTRS